MATGRGPHSQTLDRGIRILEVLASSATAMNIDQISLELAMHRSIVYRMVRTFEDHRLVNRTADGGCALGIGMLSLAQTVSSNLTAAVTPELAATADELAMTCFFVVPDADECVTLTAVEPRHNAGSLVAQRPGTRHPIALGAPGLALLMPRPAHADDRPDLTIARTRGYACSTDEVLAGLSSVAVPVRKIGAVAAVYLVGDRERIAGRLNQAAAAIARELP